MEEQNKDNHIDNTDSKQENLVQQPSVPEPVIENQTEPEVKKPYNSTLDLLPDHMRKDLDELVVKGYGGWKLKKVMEDRYLGKTTFLPVTKETFDNYVKANKERIMKVANIQKSLVEATKESLSDMKEIVDSTVDGGISLENKMQVLVSLFSKCQKRIELIEASNSSFLNPQYEQVIGAYMREQRAILETIVKLQDELNKNTGDKIYNEFEKLTYSWLVTVINCYKKIHGDTKLIEFKGSLTDDLKNVLVNFNSNKENGK